MEFQTVLEISSAILAALGGGAAIIFGFSSWLGKIWANRLMEKEKAGHAKALESLRSKLTHETESYKVKLKKSEFLFEKEFEAASEFVSLRRSFLPTYSNPGMDWHDACDEIAHRFDKIESELGKYLSKHGAILSEEVKDLISFSEGAASENKFDIMDVVVPESANKAADEMFKKLNEAEKLLIAQVRTQSST